MKSAFFACFVIYLSVTGLFSQCADEPVLDRSAILATRKILVSSSTEVSFTLLASSFRTSWQLKGSEAAAVTIFVDGKYNQDLLLFSGTQNMPAENAKSFSYEVLLGKMEKGMHTIDVMLNRKHSASRIGPIDITDMQVRWGSLEDFLRGLEDGPKTRGTRVDPQHRRAQLLAVANAPMIYARPDAVDKFTDIPLAMYYEIFDDPDEVKRIRYTVIFTNEDGGTQSKALMARWGRMTDIEWIYETRIDRKGSITSETYQAANHQTVDFKGKRVFGSHPLIYTVTDNNNFSDTGCSALRFTLAPYEADLSNSSRESVMEKLPWTYRLMAEEMLREGRVGANSREPNVVDDPREYVYAEIYNDPESSAIALEVTTTDGRKFSSDLGSPLLRVDRPGYLRIALRLPADVDEKTIKEYSIRCYPKGSASSGVCKNLKLIKLVRLNENYFPIERKFVFPSQTVRAGDAAVFTMIGAVPNSDWLNGCVACDEAGFSKTGSALSPQDLERAHWPLDRPPNLLETSLPGVFAAGDVRAGNVKRVASAVGEGSIAVSFVHRVLTE